MKKLISITLIVHLLFLPLYVEAALTDSLISYWTLDEASGTRSDSHGTNDLTDNNTVLAATGIINDGADFEAGTNEYLNDTSFSGDAGGDLSFSFWMKTESLVSGPVFYHPSPNGFQIQVDASQKMFIRFWNNASAGTQWYANTTVYNNATLYHFVITLDVSAAGSGLTVWRDGSNITSSFTNEDASASSRNAASGQISMGRQGGVDYFDGVLDEFLVSNKLFTSDEVAELYNSGAGLAYPFASPEDLVNRALRGADLRGAVIYGTPTD